MQSIVEILAQELGQKQQYIENVVNLIDEGNTIPFIARYRKEMHGLHCPGKGIRPSGTGHLCPGWAGY